jgi:hypothetical protein
MIKKAALIISLASFAISVFTGAAFAMDPSGSSPKMTDDNTTLPAVDKTVFEWGTKPYAYIQFNLADVEGEPLTIVWTWKFDTSYAATETLTLDDPTGTTGDTEHVNIWKDLTNWDTIKTGKAGDWTVSAHYDGAGGGGIRSDGFKLNVVPEPVSSALFLIGGTCLAAWQIRKKKKSA